MVIKLPFNYQKSLSEMKFIDLFAGIGGFRLALESFGAKCVFSCEINKHACLTYQKNFGNNPYSDIRQIKPSEIPPHDILCAGFPCQALQILHSPGHTRKCLQTAPLRLKSFF